jgi:hypothetical protein
VVTTVELSARKAAEELNRRGRGNTSRWQAACGLKGRVAEEALPVLPRNSASTSTAGLTHRALGKLLLAAIIGCLRTRSGMSRRAVCLFDQLKTFFGVDNQFAQNGHDSRLIGNPESNSQPSDPMPQPNSLFLKLHDTPHSLAAERSRS